LVVSFSSLKVISPVPGKSGFEMSFSAEVWHCTFLHL
jgi:hypothetical protein